MSHTEQVLNALSAEAEENTVRDLRRKFPNGKEEDIRALARRVKTYQEK